jgi:tetratricopeptide (TPR) repeat protein
MKVSADDMSSPMDWTERVGLTLATVVNERHADAKHVREYHRPIIDFLLKGEFRDADRECMIALEKHPDDCLLHTLYALSIWSSGDEVEIQRALQTAHSLSNELCITWNALGDFSGQVGDKFHAMLAFELSILIDEDQALPRKILYVYYHDAKMWDKCAELCRELIRLEPQEVGSWGNLELSLSSLDDHSRAEEIAHRTAEEYPDNYLSWWVKGMVLLHHDKWREAEYSARRAIQLNRKDPDCYHLLGVSYLYRGQISAAIKNFRRVVRLRPSDAASWYNLANALAMAGQLEETNRVLEHVEEIDPIFSAEVSDILLQKMETGVGPSRIRYVPKKG